MNHENFPDSVCRQLLRVSDDGAAFRLTVDGLIHDLLASPFWDSGSVRRLRVIWTRAREARDEDRAVFESPGVYVWGAADRPLYVGITGSTFRKRFSRYIWQSRSQCNLANDYEAELLANGIDGFPDCIREWYAKGFGNSLVRLRGANRFAREGIARVWFTLFPHNNEQETKLLERLLVRQIGKWNEERGLPPLLNIEHARNE